MTSPPVVRPKAGRILPRREEACGPGRSTDSPPRPQSSVMRQDTAETTVTLAPEDPVPGKGWVSEAGLGQDSPFQSPRSSQASLAAQARRCQGAGVPQDARSPYPTLGANPSWHGLWESALSGNFEKEKKRMGLIC